MLVNVVIVLAMLSLAMGNAGSGKKTIAGMLLVKNAVMSRSQNVKKNANKSKGGI